MSFCYALQGEDAIVTPALVYYKELIEQNIELAIRIAGSAGRLWPHVKTHKSADMVRLMMQHGIVRFKAATIAEAEMAASCGAEHVLLAYPLVGPNPARLLRLKQAFPHTTFWAIGDDFASAETLSALAVQAGTTVRFLVDVNMGLNRTGVAIPDCEAFFLRCRALPGLQACGFHCYDGNHNAPDPEERKLQVRQTAEPLMAMRGRLEANCGPLTFVMGGTPSFPCYVPYADTYLSPGTCFLNDAGYGRKYADLPFANAAVVLTRVVSHPCAGRFTLDLGYKGIAADPEGPRGVILGGEKAYRSVMQNEEHWIFETVEPGAPVPPVGKMLYVIPTHICPTSALYPAALLAENGRLTGEWPITARNRRITY